ncbi:MAG TPA: glutathione S-transferase family protein [Rhizomicrobium sp.]|nr:glutathione S-transferase family protein [Rhizomicrobium sp.]
MPMLHQMQMSGNCYKVRLAARQTGHDLVLRDYPLFDGETRKPDFLAKNANGRVPLLEWEDGRALPESNAIIWHLAEGTPLTPCDAWSRAEALSWMFFEQYSHEPYIAVARYWLGYAPKDQLETKQHLVAEWHERGNHALCVMNGHLEQRNWFAGKCYSVADIALYAYTHCANEGGFDLSAFPAVLRWIGRVREQPGHVALADRW